MKKMDEMERNIQLRSEEWGYRTVLTALALWTFYNCWQTLGNGAAYCPLPGLILCFTVCVQGFFQAAIKRRMIAGDDEYREPACFFRIIIGMAAAAAAVLLAGTFLIIAGRSV